MINYLTYIHTLQPFASSIFFVPLFIYVDLQCSWLVVFLLSLSLFPSSCCCYDDEFDEYDQVLLPFLC